MRRADYDTKIQALLSDTKTYSPLKKDTTSLINILKQ